MVDILDPGDPPDVQRDALKRELQRLDDLQELRSMGISIAVESARQISAILADPSKEVSVRDMNRSMEIVTKTAIMADEALEKSERAEVEATAPQRNIVLIILESNVPDDRKREHLVAVAKEIGPEGPQVVYQALCELSNEDRAKELIELEA